MEDGLAKSLSSDVRCNFLFRGSNDIPGNRKISATGGKG